VLAVVTITANRDSDRLDPVDTGASKATNGSAADGSPAVGDGGSTAAGGQPGATDPGAGGSNAGGGSPNAAAASTTGPPCPGANDEGLVCGGSDVPAEVRLEGTTGLRDGQEVRVRVEAQDGLEVFAFEARLCAGDARFGSNAQFDPTQTGRCVTKPLSDLSDDYIEVLSAPPHKVAEGAFRVGIGAEEFSRQDGSTLKVACGPTTPCQLILRIVHTKGYGYKAFPLEYGQ